MNWFTHAYQQSQHRLRRRRRRDLFTFLFIWFLLPLLGISFFIFTVRSHQTSKIRQIQELQVERVSLQGEHDELSRALAELSSRRRICRIASEQLGMRNADPDDIIRVIFEEESGEVVGAADRSRDQIAAFPVERRTERSPIHALTHFFALYVF
jgi:cell division protein FtsL